MMAKKKSSNNLLPTLKNHSQFKSMEIQVFINSKYFENFENFKHHLPHVNGV